MFHWLAYYNGVRFSSENWSGLLATLGFLTFPLRHSGPGQLTPTGGSSAFGSGMLFGLAFLCRYQIGLLIGGFGVWLLIYNQHAWRDVFRVVVGGLIVVVAAYPLSYWLYGEWTVPAWNYLNQNLIEGKAAGYGTRPFYAYVELVFLRGIPPLSLVYLLAFGYFLYAFRREPLTFMCTAFVLLHSLLARKDIRFLFPLIPLVPILVAGAIGAFDAPRGPKIWQKSWVKWLLVVALVVNSVALLITVIRPPASEIGPAKFVYRNYSRVTLTGPDARIVRAEGTVARYYHRPAYRLRRTCDRAPCLYVHHTPGPGSLPQNGELVYTDRPRWLHELGLGPYLDRFRWWYVYELP
jgi:phosphatidylinositol glycan class B